MSRAVHSRRRALVAVALSAATTLAGCALSPTVPPSEAARPLLPTGALRVGLYPGTPTSIIGDASAPDAKGVGFDLGKAMAARANVRFVPVVYANNAQVFAAARSGAVDAVFTNATPARREALAFSPTVIEVEQGYLVPASSPMRAIADVDREDARIGVAAGSTSEATLTQTLKHAKIVAVASLQDAVAALAAGDLDAFATNKATLYEMSAKLPGSTVLPGRWGLESFAIGVPKSRERGMPFVAAFVVDAKSSGLVSRAIERAGLRGAIVAP